MQRVGQQPFGESAIHSGPRARQKRTSLVQPSMENAASQHGVDRRGAEVPSASPPRPPLAAPPGGDVGNSSSGDARGAPMTVSPPIYFLVREQAKSLIAIKELHDRIRYLEDSQGSLLDVVKELKLDFGRGFLSAGASVAQPDVAKTFVRPRLNSDMERNSGKKYSKDESADNKQDSGVDSDCQAQLSVTNVSQPKSAVENKAVYDREDELLMLLELINQRGVKLRQRVDEFEDQMQRPDQLETLSYQDVASLLQKCRGLQKKLKDVYCERDHLRGQLDLYENVVVGLRNEKKRLEGKLESTVQEKKQMETRIHRLHGQFVKGVCQDNVFAEGPKTAKDVEKEKRLKRRSLDESKNKISEVLKERSSLELQRQMLHMILENESLTQSLNQSELQRFNGATEWEKREEQMLLEIRNLNKEKDELSRQLGQSKIENTDVSAKVKLLERALQAVSQDSKIANQQLGGEVSATVQKRRASTSAYNQPLTPKPASSHVYQSLPPGMAVMSNHTPSYPVHYFENEVHHPLQDTSSYLNISLEEPELEALENPELDFRKCLPPNRSSTPISGNRVKYTSKVEVKSCQTKSIHSGGDRSDLTRICSEFDPLVHSNEDKVLKMTEFMDSLDALPSNNVMFVPVSVAKVSMRPDMSRYPSPLLQRYPYPSTTQRSNGVPYPVQNVYRQMAVSVDAGLL